MSYLILIANQIFQSITNLVIVFAINIIFLVYHILIIISASTMRT